MGTNSKNFTIEGRFCFLNDNIIMENITAITEEEATQLLEVYLNNALEEIDEEKCQSLIRWATKARVDSMLLGLILKGLIVITNVKDDTDLTVCTPDGVSKNKLASIIDQYLDKKFTEDGV